MTTPLPDWCVPHLVKVRALQAGGGMGDTYLSSRDIAAFVLDERTLVRDASGAEVVSSATVHLDFTEVVPLGSLVTVWPGLSGEREAMVLAIGRFEAPGWPAYQTLSLT